jgi:hypothetical protein
VNTTVRWGACPQVMQGLNERSDTLICCAPWPRG